MKKKIKALLKVYENGKASNTLVEFELNKFLLYEKKEGYYSFFAGLVTAKDIDDIKAITLELVTDEEAATLKAGIKEESFLHEG